MTSVNLCDYVLVTDDILKKIWHEGVVMNHWLTIYIKFVWRELAIMLLMMDFLERQQ